MTMLGKLTKDTALSHSNTKRSKMFPAGTAVRVRDDSMRGNGYVITARQDGERYERSGFTRSRFTLLED